MRAGRQPRHRVPGVLSLALALLVGCDDGGSATSSPCLESSAQTWVQARSARAQLPLAWPPGALCLRYAVDHREHKELSAESLASAVAAGFARWSEAECSGFCVEPAATTSDDAPPALGYREGATDNRNIVYAEPSADAFLSAFGRAALSATLVTSDLTTGEILDADIVLNIGAFRFVDTNDPARCSDTSTADLAGVLIHETGHLLGLEHTSNPESAMFGAWHGTEGCDLAVTTLSAGDQSGVATLYPNADASCRCAP